MIPRRIDSLVAALATSAVSRRRFARLAGGGALAALLARLGLEDAAAGRPDPGQRCRQWDRCRGGARCRQGRCRCRTGQIVEGRRCRPADRPPDPFQGTCRRGQDTCSLPLEQRPICNGRDDCSCSMTTARASFCGQ
jgi:hypothetical protein